MRSLGFFHGTPHLPPAHHTGRPTGSIPMDISGSRGTAFGSVLDVAATPSSLPAIEALPSALSSTWAAAGSSLTVRLFLRRNRPTKSPRLLCSRRHVDASTPAESAQAVPRLPGRTRRTTTHACRQSAYHTPAGRAPAKGSGLAEIPTKSRSTGQIL